MLKTTASIFFFLICTSFSINDVHDFHLSNSELKYKASKSQIQLGIQIFIDDLEAALAKRGVEGLRIGTERESEDSVDHVGEYLADAFQISAGSNLLIPEIIGTELSEDLAALWCYVRFPIEQGCEEIKVTNTVLTEMFDDQKNIVSFRTENGSRQYFTFDSADTENIFSCE